MSMWPRIKGKYLVRDARGNKYNIKTDNALEAIWEANKFPDIRTIENKRGEKNFYKDEGKWKIV